MFGQVIVDGVDQGSHVLVDSVLDVGVVVGDGGTFDLEPSGRLSTLRLNEGGLAQSIHSRQIHLVSRCRVLVALFSNLAAN